MSAEVDRLRAVTHAQHAELLELRKAVAGVRALCADRTVQPFAGLIYAEEVLAVLDGPVRP